MNPMALKTYHQAFCSYCGNVGQAVQIVNLSGEHASWMCYPCLRQAGTVLANSLFAVHNHKLPPEEESREIHPQ